MRVRATRPASIRSAGAPIRCIRNRGLSSLCSCFGYSNRKFSAYSSTKKSNGLMVTISITRPTSTTILRLLREHVTGDEIAERVLLPVQKMLGWARPSANTRGSAYARAAQAADRIRCGDKATLRSKWYSVLWRIATRMDMHTPWPSVGRKWKAGFQISRAIRMPVHVGSSATAGFGSYYESIAPLIPGKQMTYCCRTQSR